VNTEALMRLFMCGLGVAMSVLVGLSPVAAPADCLADPPGAVPPNPACGVVKLGWRVVDPGPPIRFQPDDGTAGVELAVTVPGRPRPDEDPVRWAAGQFSALGPFDCRGNLLDGAKVATVDCSMPPGPGGARKGGVIVIKTMIGLQVIGVVMPAGADVPSLVRSRFGPVVSYFADFHGVGITAHAAREVMFGGRAHYLAPGAGFPASAVEGVYHHWNWRASANMGMVDGGADYVLFRNGEAWRSPDAAPQDINPAKAKEARWDDWGTWRRAGDDVVLTMNGAAGERFAPQQFIRYDPAGADQRVEGRWQSSLAAVTTAAGHATGAMASRSITLHSDGRFERDGFGSASFSSQTGAAGTFAAAGPARSGRYRIDGYRLELTYDDGRSDSALFYWAGGKDDRFGMLFINGVKFLGGVSR
jgi:hypothetical protein